MIKKLTVAFALISVFGLSCSPSDNSAATKSELSPVDSQVFNQAMNQLMMSSLVWPSLETNVKLRAIQVVIDLYKIRENTAILQTPQFYLERIDEGITQNISMGNLPFPELVKIIAVMEYDFYNGRNKDELALETLGQRMYEANRQRREEIARRAG